MDYTQISNVLNVWLMSHMFEQPGQSLYKPRA